VLFGHGMPLSPIPSSPSCEQSLMVEFWMKGIDFEFSMAVMDSKIPNGFVICPMPSVKEMKDNNFPTPPDFYRSLVKVSRKPDRNLGIVAHQRPTPIFSPPWTSGDQYAEDLSVDVPLVPLPPILPPAERTSPSPASAPPAERTSPSLSPAPEAEEDQMNLDLGYPPVCL